jgi:hypothetical protein
VQTIQQAWHAHASEAKAPVQTIQQAWHEHAFEAKAKTLMELALWAPTLNISASPTAVTREDF